MTWHFHSCKILYLRQAKPLSRDPPLSLCRPVRLLRAQVGACPDGMSKCSVDGKGVCVPSLEGKVGHDLCNVFKAVCQKGTIVAKTCTA